LFFFELEAKIGEERLGDGEIVEKVRRIGEEALQDKVIIEKVEKLAHAGLQHIVFWNLTGMVNPAKNTESLKIIEDILTYIKGS